MTSPKPQPGRWYPLDASRHVYPGFIHLNYLFGQELAVWCSSSGQVHVWECRPPGAADDVRPGLSVDDDDVVYRYLGCRGRSTDRGAELMLNALGPDGSRVKTYATLERDGMIWVSPGIAPAHACPSLESGATYCREYVVAMEQASVAAAAMSSGFTHEQAQVLRSNGFATAETALVLLQPLGGRCTCVHLMLTAPGRRIPDPWRMKAASAALKSAIKAWEIADAPDVREVGCA